MSGYKQVRRALLSVTDKTGLVPFAQQLADHNIELVSTGGTARALREAGLTVRDISDLTEFPEMLDGRVKTLHPKVHGGILFMREKPEHRAAVEQHGIQPIDMVVVNLYAFEKTASKPGAAFAEIIENIDIGGPSMVRSAAKNFEDVAIVTSVADYSAIADELAANSGGLSRQTRWRLAQKAFSITAAYDTAIANTLERVATSEPAEAPVQFADPAKADFPSTLRIAYPLAASLRYGENPHQRAALYADGSASGIAGATQLQGKELSYNNLVDLDACWDLAQEFDAPGVAIIKHTNPCGAATGATILEAYQKALAADPVSAFGSVIGINREVDAAAADEIAKLFVEAIAAPSFSPEARARFAAKKNLRLVEVRPAETARVIKQVSGGLLLQDADHGRVAAADLKVATARKPTDDELAALLFAWRVCKHVKSNAIVYARNGQVLGVGAGQMSRVDAAKFGAMKAILPLAGCVAASDAFFPFPDGLEVVVSAGATAVIQPGGSVKDPDVIAAADRLGIAMVFTGMRHFRH
ncbi:MAG TPA: bifunctional phosphoribosylaminoimidazolecarboxamide formyltransferase/IMP cyclohydrolase [Acidobacteriaceae bacterium]|nr:bifunctional phosphoribosylaminoimidazolecarboxamide formyltransferase/IMP cyclohydrolase [Acidobacteriaceae bacterium]